MTYANQALQSHDLSGEGINFGSHTYFFLTTQGHGGPPWISDQLNAGAPPRQHKHERRYTPSTHPFILTRRISEGNYDGQIIFGEPCGPKASWHLSYRWGNTRKKPHPGNLSRPGIEPGPAAWLVRMLPPAPRDGLLWINLKKNIWCYSTPTRPEQLNPYSAKSLGDRL